MRTITVYPANGPKYECAKGQIESRKDFDVQRKGTMSDVLLHGYYQVEQEKGSRFNSGYSKNQIKRVCETRNAEREAGIVWKQPPPPVRG